MGMDGPGGGGDVKSSAAIPDNAIVTGDGGAKGVQGSLLEISDSGLLDMKTGGIKDQFVAGGLPLGEVGTTGIAAQFDAVSIMGGINESKKRILVKPAKSPTISIAAAGMSAVYEIDTSDSDVLVTIPDADAATNELWLSIIKQTSDANLVTVQTASLQVIGDTNSQIIAEPKKGFSILADGTATPDGEYEVTQDSRFSDAPLSGSFDFFLSDTANVIPGYLTMFPTDPAEAEASVVSASLGVGADQLIEEWATELGAPGFTLLQEGVYEMHIHAEKTTGNKSAIIHWNLYTRTVGGVETLLTTSQNSGLLTVVPRGVSMHASLGADVVMLDTDILVAKVFATVSGGGSDVEIALLIKGNTAARVDIPASNAQFDARFVIKTASPPQTIAGDVNVTTQAQDDDTTLIASTEYVDRTALVRTESDASNRVLALTDINKTIKFTAAADLEFPQDSAVLIPVGSVGVVRSTGAITPPTITKGTGAIFEGVFGNVNLELTGTDGFFLTWEKVSANTFLIRGHVVNA